MTNENKRCCGSCQLFDWFGKRNERGEKVGHCPEFAAAGEIVESWMCHPGDAYRPKMSSVK